MSNTCNHTRVIAGEVNTGYTVTHNMVRLHIQEERGEHRDSLLARDEANGSALLEE